MSFGDRLLLGGAAAIIRVTLDVNTQKALQGILGHNLPTIGPTALPTATLSVPLHNSPGLPSLPLPLPTTGATTCITLLGQPVCTPRLGSAGLDPALAKMMMPGVTG